MKVLEKQKGLVRVLKLWAQNINSRHLCTADAHSPATGTDSDFHANEKSAGPLPKGDGIADAFSCLKRHLRDRTAREGTLKADAPFLYIQWSNGAHGSHPQTVERRNQISWSRFGRLGTHSLGIGGGTDHFVGGTPPLELQIAGRWDSDIGRRFSNQTTHTASHQAR